MKKIQTKKMHIVDDPTFFQNAGYWKKLLVHRY